MKPKKHDQGGHTAGPHWLTGPQIERRLKRGDDPIDIMIDMYQIAILHIIGGWKVDRRALLTPIIRNDAGTDPVCAQYEVCSDCPLNERACEMIIDATSRPADDKDRYIAIVNELKKIAGTKLPYGPKTERVRLPKRRVNKLTKRRLLK